MNLLLAAAEAASQAAVAEVSPAAVAAEVSPAVAAAASDVLKYRENLEPKG